MVIMLIIGAIAAMIAAAAGSSDLYDRMLQDLRRALRRHVDDRAQREAGLRQLDQLEREAAVLVAQLRGWIRSFGRVHRRHQSSLADYEALAEVLVEQVYAAELGLLAAAEQLRETIGESAWLAISEEVEQRAGKAHEQQQRREPKPRRAKQCRS